MELHFFNPNIVETQNSKFLPMVSTSEDKFTEKALFAIW